MNIKELLTAARENISQEELADQIGIENKKISKWEMGDTTSPLRKEPVRVLEMAVRTLSPTA